VLCGLEDDGVAGGEHAGGHPARAEHLAGVVAGPGQVVDRQGDLEDGVGVRLAVLPVHQFGQLVHPPGEVAAVGDEPLLAVVVPERRHRAAAGRARSTVSRTAPAPCTGKTPTTAPVAGSVDSKVSVVSCRSTVPAVVGVTLSIWGAAAIPSGSDVPKVTREVTRA